MQKLIIATGALALIVACYSGPTPQDNRDDGYFDINTCEKYGWCLQKTRAWDAVVQPKFLNEGRERSPDAPNSPDAPEVSEVPDAPEATEASKSPEAPEAPDTPDNPGNDNPGNGCPDRGHRR